MTARTLIPSWHALTKRRPHDQVAQPAANLDLEEVPVGWHPAELAVLNAHLKRPCYLESVDVTFGGTLKSALLSINPRTSSILLDTCWPNEAANEALVHHRFHTCLLHQQNALMLQFVVTQLLKLRDGPALAARIVSHSLQPASRPRVFFADARAPEADLLVPCDGLWRASLYSLGADGLSIRGFYPHPPKWAGNIGRCTLGFGSEFRLDVGVRIGAVTRQPHRQCLMELTYRDNNLELQNQIQCFVEMLTSKAR